MPEMAEVFRMPLNESKGGRLIDGLGRLKPTDANTVLGESEPTKE